MASRGQRAQLDVPLRQVQQGQDHVRTEEGKDAGHLAVGLRRLLERDRRVKLDLNDPASVAAWYRIAPQRHGQILRHWLRCEMFRDFWPAIVASRELVRC